MDLRHITTFVKVVEKQSFSKAAASLGYTQAAVTIQIKQLEEELGTKLFDRMNRKIYLTEEGESFIFYANEILRTIDEAKHYKSARNTAKGVLRVGTVGSLGVALMPQLIYDFHQVHPGVEVKVKIGKTDDLVEMIQRNEIDILYTLDHNIYHSELRKFAMKRERIIFVSKDKAWEQTKSIHLKDVQAEPFLLTEQGEAYRHDLEHFLADQKLSLNAVLEVGDISVIRSVLKQGLGIAYLPEFSVISDINCGYLVEVPIKGPDANMWCQLIVHEKKFLTEPMKTFVRLVDPLASVDLKTEVIR